MLEPDRDQIEIFVNALFRHAAPQGFVSLRAFYEDGGAKPFRITPTSLAGGLKFLVDVAEDDARRAANDPQARRVLSPDRDLHQQRARRRERPRRRARALRGMRPGPDRGAGRTRAAALPRHPGRALRRHLDRPERTFRGQAASSLAPGQAGQRYRARQAETGTRPGGAHRRRRYLECPGLSLHPLARKLAQEVGAAIVRDHCR